MPDVQALVQSVRNDATPPGWPPAKRWRPVPTAAGLSPTPRSRTCAGAGVVTATPLAPHRGSPPLGDWRRRCDKAFKVPSHSGLIVFHGSACTRSSKVSIASASTLWRKRHIISGSSGLSPEKAKCATQRGTPCEKPRTFSVWGAICASLSNDVPARVPCRFTRRDRHRGKTLETSFDEGTACS
jgi:hypothetical protein